MLMHLEKIANDKQFNSELEWHKNNEYIECVITSIFSVQLVKWNAYIMLSVTTGFDYIRKHVGTAG